MRTVYAFLRIQCALQHGDSAKAYYERIIGVLYLAPPQKAHYGRSVGVFMPLAVRCI